MRTAPIEQPLLSVVGVVPDFKQNWDPNVALEPVMYVPYRQGQTSRAMVIIARVQAGDAQLAPLPFEGGAKGQQCNPGHGRDDIAGVLRKKPLVPTGLQRDLRDLRCHRTCSGCCGDLCACLPTR